MPDPEQPSVQDPGAPPRRAPRRRGHPVVKIILGAVVVLALVTGLSVALLYRHLNSNLTVIDVTEQLDNRPDEVRVEGPSQPVNILVMGSDTREGAGNNIDGLTDDGERSDTTILMHLSADGERAYGVSIPRDSLIDRPECRTKGGEAIVGATDTLWNEAFALGGPACTIQQFEQLTGVRLDHYVVIDFQGFQDMVDAIGGVEVCIPDDIVDPEHGINIPAGTREIEGKEALSYVRARYTLGDGSDIGRIKRQQAFIAAMANKVISGGTLARLDRLVGFLNAATKSLTLDEGLENVYQIAKVGRGFQNIGLDNIRFLTVPWAYDTREEFRGRVLWKPEAAALWEQIANDEPLSRGLSEGAIDAGNVPGTDSPGGPASPRDDEETEALAEAGLCT